MAIHHRVSKDKIEAELQRLLRGEVSENREAPPREAPREDTDSFDPQFSLIRELATTLMIALLLSLLLVSLKLFPSRFGLETMGALLLARFPLGN